MGQCFLYGSGGSKAGLQVTGGLTAPENPKENTVWVKSDKAGTKYVFGTAAPAAPTEGLIWFTATDAGIMTKARVYTGGVWTAADAYLYIGGSWVQVCTGWAGELFDNGDQYVDHTGGWRVTGTVTAETSPNLYAMSRDGDASIRTKGTVDFSGRKTLKFTGSGYGNISGNLTSATCSIKSTGGGTLAQLSFSRTYDATLSVDLSTIGQTVGYIEFSASGTNAAVLSLSKVWLE